MESSAHAKEMTICRNFASENCGQDSILFTPRQVFVRFVMAALLACAWLSTAAADPLDTIALDRVKQLREVERYQLEIAEKYYREKNWKIAIAEYEKYLSLYEKSDAASYCQLKWALAQCELRKQNTAIKEGFQSVLDYWPESPDAIAAAYYIGQTYKNMGQNKEAKKSLREVLVKHPQHLVAVYAASDLIDIAGIEKDDATRVQLWKKLTFDTPRNGAANYVCVQASQQLATYAFYNGTFAEGQLALATTYQEPQLVPHVLQYLRQPLTQLSGQSETKAQGQKLATSAVAWLRSVAPTELAKPEDKLAAQAAFFGIAEVQAWSGAMEDVPKTFDELAKKFGTDDALLGKLAGWHKQQKRWEDARATYRRFANGSEGMNQVANSFREEGKVDDAVNVYRQLVGQDAEHKVQWKSEIASTYRQARKFKEAIDVYHELESDDLANVGRWRWEIATAYKDDGKLNEAIGYFRQCDNLPENLKQMAWCHRQLKQYQEAIGLYNQIVAAYPDSAASALLQSAYTREEAGETEPAIKVFQSVCKRFPKDQHASIAHAHLQNKYKISVTLGGAKDE